MIVAVVSVGMMEVTIDEVVDVIAMGNGFMAAARTVDVTVFVTGLVIVVLATVGVGLGNGNDVFFDDSVGFLVMQVTIVKVVDVITMPDCGVAAVGSMLVVVIWVGFTGTFAHGKSRVRGGGDVKTEMLSGSAYFTLFPSI